MIQFSGVGKEYVSPLRRRRVEALADFDLTMERGEVIGIAGPNGAGKSTLISLLMGFLAPSAGRVTIDGASPRGYIERQGVGYLTELVNLPPRWRVVPALHRLASYAGVPRAEIPGRVAAMVDRLGLEEHAGKQVRQLSKGNLQRLGLAQALLGEFDLVVLDEPTHGLDPLWTQRFRDVVAELRRPERIIVIASHNLDELELLADQVAILDHGRLQRVVRHSTEANANPVAWRVIFEGTPDVATALAGAVPVAGRDGTWRVLATRSDLSRGLAVLLSAGAVLVECVPEQSQLESAFREAVRQ
ncbi:MAG: ABC transporter ATP-binding protein [Gemmatimonadales bacterium]|nr:ABC transporter ATP-binding protein [Gemmatimonadales bacterium]